MKRNKEYFDYIRFLEKNFNIKIDLNKYNKEYVDFNIKNKKEINKKTFNIYWQERNNEEEFVLWIKDLSEKYELNKKEYNIEYIKEIIQKEKFNIFEKSFINLICWLLISKLEIKNLIYNLKKITEFHKEKLYEMDELKDIRMIIEFSRVKDFGYQYLIVQNKDIK